MKLRFEIMHTHYTTHTHIHTLISPTNGDPPGPRGQETLSLDLSKQAHLINIHLKEK